MKNSHIITCAWAALSLLSTSCSDRLEMAELQPATGTAKLVTIQAGIGRDTRMAITDSISQINYAWQSHDSFQVITSPTKAKSTTFKFDSQKSSANVASFTSVDTLDIKDGAKIYAFYNGNQPVQWDENGNITIDVNNQDGTLSDRYQYMFGQATYAEDGSTSLSFEHLVATFRLKLTLPEGVKHLKSISMSNARNSYYGLTDYATVVVKGAKNDSEGLYHTGDLVYWRYYQEPNPTLTVTNDFEVDENNQVTAYLYALPAKLYETSSNYSTNYYMNPLVIATDDQGREYACLTNSNRNVIPGDVYEISSEMYQLEDFENQKVADGRNVPYQIANERQFYTFMIRCAAEMQDPKGNRYGWYHNYVLTSDLKLNSEIPWQYLSLYYSSFDGGGHSITGTVNMTDNSLFDNIQHSTIANLIFDASISNQSNLYTPIFVDRMYQSRMIGCVNKTNATIYGGSVLAGYAWGDTNEIILCGNEGNVKIGGGNQTIGILLREMSSNNTGYSIIDGCYNTGDIVIDMSNSYFGTTDQYIGFVGRVYNNTNTIQNCWNAGELEVIKNPNDSISKKYVGTLVGWNDGYVKNSFWKEPTKYDAIGTGSTAIDCESFTATMPTVDQFNKINEGIISYGYEFDPQTGKLKHIDKTIVPYIPIEKW